MCFITDDEKFAMRLMSLRNASMLLCNATHNHFVIISSRASHYLTSHPCTPASKLASYLSVCSGIAHGYRGDKGIRTLDPLLARQVLSQLSYTPILIRQPPALPCRLQHSTIGRLGLNHRVRDENGCLPQAHRHRNLSLLLCRHVRTSSLANASHQLALGRSSFVIFCHFPSRCACTPDTNAKILHMTPWQLDSNAAPTSSASLERR